MWCGVVGVVLYSGPLHKDLLPRTHGLAFGMHFVATVWQFCRPLALAHRRRRAREERDREERMRKGDFHAPKFEPGLLELQRRTDVGKALFLQWAGKEPNASLSQNHVQVLSWRTELWFNCDVNYVVLGGVVCGVRGVV